MDNMAIPKQVIDGAAEADEALKAMAEESNVTAEPEAEGQAPAEGEARQTNPEPETSVTPAQTPAPTQDQNAEVTARLDKIEQQYRTLQGMWHGAENKVKELEAENAQLREQLAQAQQQPTKPAEPVQFDIRKVVGQERVEEMGEELLQTTAQIARAAVDEFSKPLRERLEATERELFASNLTALVPDWREINAKGKTNGFFFWLGQVHPIYKTSAQQALDRACAAMDAQATADVFRAFKASQHPESGGGQQPAKPAPAPLASQVAPSKAAGGAPPSPQKRTYTSAEYSKLCDDITKRKFTATEETALKTELDAAIREGRIR